MSAWELRRRLDEALEYMCRRADCHHCARLREMLARQVAKKVRTGS